jgi:IclR family acetate operon transcriptional repressor
VTKHEEIPARTTMKTADKALSLLNFFSPETPEFRLSDLSRAALMDKVTTMRMLASLSAAGFVEQHPETKKYRLGTAVLRLARIREVSFPVISLLQPILDALTEATGETTHAGLIAGQAITTIAIAEPHRATRVFVDPVQPLPLHATASGLAYLAYLSEERLSQTLRRIEVKAITPHTVKTEAELRAKLETIRRNGCSVSSRTFEAEVTGIAAPIFDWHGAVQGTISAACMASRLTDSLQEQVETEVLYAALRATRAMGGEPPADLLEMIETKKPNEKARG